MFDTSVLRLVTFLGIATAVYFAIRFQRRRARVIEYVILARFPILLGITLVLLPIFAITAGASMLENLVVLQPRELMFTTFLAIKAAWVVFLCGATIVKNADARFGVGAPPSIFSWKIWRGPFRFVLFGALALPIIATAVIKSELGARASALAVGQGILLVTAFLYLASALRIMILPVDAPHFAGLPRVAALPKLGARIDDWLSRSNIIRRRPNVLYRAATALGPGYTKDGALHQGHGESFGFFVLAIIVYFFGLRVLRPSFGDTSVFYEVFSQAALGYVLVLLILIGMLSSALGFFLDRFRFPVLPAMVLFTFTLSMVTDTDHYYEVTTSGKSSAALLADTTPVPQWRAAPGAVPDLVVVTASGGGIAAAYWTARVLEGLQVATNGELSRSIRMISAVSGGSVGTMFYVDGFTRDGPPARPDSIRHRAGLSSLRETTWGLVYPDFLRGIHLPLMNDYVDRGWAAEQAWRARLQQGSITLRDWRDGIAEGWRPAPIFNATIANNGQRFLISPLDLPNSRSAKSFTSVFPGADLRVTTAARLSATFPYVTPIARGDTSASPGYDADAFHVADGGYYDNYGVVSAIDWLGNVLPVYQRRGGYKVLLVQIRATKEDTTMNRFGDRKVPRGWIFATLGPLTTLANVRGSTQIVRNDTEINLLRDHWCLRGVDLQTVVFEPQKQGPLTWQLTRAELATIDRSWEDTNGRPIPEIRPKLDSIAGFFAYRQPNEQLPQRAERCRDQAIRSAAAN